MLRRSLLYLSPLALALAFGAVVAAREPAPAAAAAAPAAAARQTYLADCSTCHGASAEGTRRGPPLLDTGRAATDYMLSTGRMPLSSPTATMRRSTPRYGPALRRALVDYVALLAKGRGPDIPKVDVAAGDVARGGELYRLQCAACHAWGGEGGALYQRAAPSVLPATPTQVAEAVRTGPGTMPVFGEAAISKRQLNDLVAYKLELDHPDNRGGQPLSHLGPVAEGAVAIVGGLGIALLFTRWLGEAR